MQLSVEDARRAVEQYVSKRPELPKDARITRGFERNNLWNFKLRWRPPELGREFDILYIQVDDAATVTVDDMQAEMHAILDNPYGIEREDRLIRAVRENRTVKPWWIIKTRRSKPFMDRKGIDGFVLTSMSDDGSEMQSLPFQVKSSVAGLEDYYERHPNLRGIVTGIVVRDSEPDDTLVHNFVTNVGATRNRILSGVISVVDFKRVLTDHVTGAAR